VAHLSLSLLGTLEVKVDNQPVTAPITGKARALLAYLAVEADRQVAEALAGLLWPDWPARSARANLRNALSNLRKAIGDRDAEPPFLLVTWETIQLNRAGDCWVDAWTFGELVQGTETHPMEQAITLYRGPFLQGFSVADSPAFEDWVLVVRERLERQVLEALQSLTAYDEERGAYARAREHAQRRVEVAPWQEQAHQVLRALDDPRAEEILDASYQLFQERAKMIDDEVLHRSYLENVPYHREIIEAWEARNH
jgi:DNA-binding SARP family transcriptional activator